MILLCDAYIFFFFLGRENEKKMARKQQYAHLACRAMGKKNLPLMHTNRSKIVKKKWNPCTHTNKHTHTHTHGIDFMDAANKIQKKTIDCFLHLKLLSYIDSSFQFQSLDGVVDNFFFVILNSNFSWFKTWKNSIPLFILWIMMIIMMIIMSTIITRFLFFSKQKTKNVCMERNKWMNEFIFVFSFHSQCQSCCFVFHNYESD